MNCYYLTNCTQFTYPQLTISLRVQYFWVILSFYWCTPDQSKEYSSQCYWFSLIFPSCVNYRDLRFQQSMALAFNFVVFFPNQGKASYSEECSYERKMLTSNNHYCIDKDTIVDSSDYCVDEYLTHLSYIFAKSNLKIHLHSHQVNT